MVDRTDPGRTGVKAGRLVGIATGGLAVLSLFRVEDTVYALFGVLLDAVGLAALPVAVVFWANAALAAAGRYSFTVVVASLVGVGYDSLGRPHVAVLLPLVLAVGLADAAFAWLDTRSLAIAGLYVLAWLSYVPAFALFHEEGSGRHDGPLRLGDP
mgnify:CR=1 FL=1